MDENVEIVVPRKRSRVERRRRQTGALPLAGALPAIGGSLKGLLAGTGATAVGSKLLSGLKNVGSKAGKSAKKAGGAGGATSRQALASGAGGFGLSEWLRRQELGPIKGEQMPMLALIGGGLLVGALTLSGGIPNFVKGPAGLALGAGVLVGGALLLTQ